VCVELAMRSSHSRCPISWLQLYHENIVKLVDLFFSPEGNIFIVTEAMVASLFFSHRRLSWKSIHACMSHHGGGWSHGSAQIRANHM
jgi:hypothetical protein